MAQRSQQKQSRTVSRTGSARGEDRDFLELLGDVVIIYLDEEAATVVYEVQDRVSTALVGAPIGGWRARRYYGRFTRNAEAVLPGDFVSIRPRERGAMSRVGKVMYAFADDDGFEGAHVRWSRPARGVEEIGLFAHEREVMLVEECADVWLRDVVEKVPVSTLPANQDKVLLPTSHSLPPYGIER